MTTENLRQTDQFLPKLLGDFVERRLGERQFIPVKSELSTLEEQLSYIVPFLAKIGVPISVWEKVVTNCMAALNADSSYVSNDRPRRITIIGGRGRMGKLFIQQLSAAGHNVSILGSSDWDNADTLLGQADLVLVSVPIDRTEDVIKRAAKYLSPTTALADFTSIKTQPLEAMLEHHIGPVMGLHPMFGPAVESFSGQKFVVCPGRNNDVFQWFLELIESKGGQIILCTPEEHDRMMVIVQATRHFSRFSVGVFLAEENIDVERSLLLSTANYRQEIDIVKRLFAQNPHLCVEIMLATEERCQAIANLAETYSRLAQLVAQKDRAALVKEFERARNFFTEGNNYPIEESKYAINALTNS